MKRDVFESAMKKHLSGLAEWNTPEAGMFFWCVLFFSFMISPFPFNLLTPARLILQVQVVIK